MNKDHLDAIAVLTEQECIAEMKYKLTDCSEYMNDSQGLFLAMSILSNASMGYAPTQDEIKESVLKEAKKYIEENDITDRYIIWDDENECAEVMSK